MGRPRKTPRPAPEPGLSLEDALRLLLAVAPRVSALADNRKQWQRWYEYRAERGLPNTTRALKSQALDLEALGQVEAWHAIEWTLANADRGWMTLYPKPKSLPRPPLPGVAKAVGAATAGYLAGLSTPDQRVFTDYQDEARRLPNWPKTSMRDGLGGLLDKVDNNLPRPAAALFRKWIDDEFHRPQPSPAKP